ncbi:MAG: hypothetical protein E7305_06655 [Butyrivibrio sp.]|nr:hypothetical protein [Butyrivibrio sp.]
MSGKRIIAGALCVLLILTVIGCGQKENASGASYDGKEYIKMSELTEAGLDMDKAGEEKELLMSLDLSLSVPTYITKIGDTWFIVDCYHNKVIYSDSLDTPIQAWNIMCDEVIQPHTLASDGTVFLVDDTENNRVLVYERWNDKFLNTQVFSDIGNRPHYSVYDEGTKTFYVWSSESGEMYCFRRPDDSTRLYLTDVRKVDELSSTYVRSFTIIDGDIYFVSGLSADGSAPRILVCDLDSFKVKKSYKVPDEIAGMVQMMKIEDMFYITISTDITGNQDYATMIRTKSLNDLSEGEYEDIYSEYFIGGGTPYNISRVEDTYFLTEHRLIDHQIWSFNVEDGQIVNVQTVF